MYIHISIYLSLSLYIYIYIYIQIHRQNYHERFPGRWKWTLTAFGEHIKTAISSRVDAQQYL